MDFIISVFIVLMVNIPEQKWNAQQELIFATGSP